jgi:hypothetical protein
MFTENGDLGGHKLDLCPDLYPSIIKTVVSLPDSSSKRIEQILFRNRAALLSKATITTAAKNINAM